MGRMCLYLIGACWLINCQPAATEQQTVPKDLSFTNLFDARDNDSVACYRIPALVSAPNGDLLAAIDERVPNCNDLRGSRDINIVLRRSNDNGDTWRPIETIVDFPPGQSASDPSMIVDRMTGEVLLFYNFMDLDREPDVYYLHLIRSKDDGNTWTRPEDITGQITPSDWKEDFKFITSGRGFQTADGRLVHCMVNLDRGMHIFQSLDHGKSWELIPVAISPADESKIVELSDGRWMINSRVRDAGLRYVHLSDDQGKSWKSRPDSTLIDPACNASIIRYDYPGYAGQPIWLFSNAASEDKRENMTIKVSVDDGESWSAGKQIYAGSAAYSSLTILKNGEIGLLFEKDDYQENVFVRVSLDWLLAR